MILGVTGVIGSGKSFVARELASLLGAEHCDADRMCHDFLRPGALGWQGVRQKWGSRFICDDQSLNTPVLREAIFNDPVVRHDLEEILHPCVEKGLEQTIARCRRDGTSLVAEIPLLFEVGWEKMFDKIVTVYADLDICRSRVMQRDSVQAAQVEKTLASQMDIHEKCRRADYIIDNSDALETTLLQLRELAEILNADGSEVLDTNL